SSRSRGCCASRMSRARSSAPRVPSRCTTTQPRRASSSTRRHSRRSTKRSTASSLCKREDVEQFDVETVGRAGRELRDPVTLFEDQHELLSRVVDSIDLLEPELERRGLLPFDKHHARLDVVRAAELVAFP